MRAPWKSQLTILLAGLTVILAGCLVSGTKVFEYDVVRNGNMGRPIDVFAAPIEAIAVDLESNDTFEAHKGDIKHIDRLGFSASIDNSGGSATTPRRFSAAVGKTVDFLFRNSPRSVCGLTSRLSPNWRW